MKNRGKMVESSRTRCPGVRSLLAIGALLAVPRPAGACFFYDPGPEDLVHVDQTATRVLLQQVGTRTKAIFQVQYQGNADSFAWLIPVPALPTFDVADSDPFGPLDYATAPTLRYGSYSDATAFSDSGGGCGGASAERSAADDYTDQYSKVVVWDSDRVGPYAYQVFTAEAVDDLTTWLQTNGYPIPPGAEALLDQYIREASFIVGVKLDTDADQTAVLPIVLEYEGTAPAVPLRLSQLSAVDDMGLLVYVLGDRQFVPGNWAHVAIADSKLEVDQYTETDNYEALVDEAVETLGGGRAFVTEYAQPASVLREEIFDSGTLELLRDASYVTRLYSRVDPEDMTLDPTFVPAEDATPDVSNVHDLVGMDPDEALTIAPLALLLLRRRRRPSTARAHDQAGGGTDQPAGGSGHRS